MFTALDSTSVKVSFEFRGSKTLSGMLSESTADSQAGAIWSQTSSAEGSCLTQYK